MSRQNGSHRIGGCGKQDRGTSQQCVPAGIQAILLMAQGFNGLLGRLDRMEKALKDQQKEIADLKKEVTDLKKEAVDLKKEVADLKKEYQVLKRKTYGLVTGLGKKLERIRHLKKKLMFKGVSPYPIQLKKVKNEHKLKIANKIRYSIRDSILLIALGVNGLLGRLDRMEKALKDQQKDYRPEEEECRPEERDCRPEERVCRLEAKDPQT
ncbi:hypothetical protein BV898_07344 [Hypsibius exemplaris]|uniref:Uncharacterized protein n=1 Tax=Hypsibius exemplaris TaxID=2072580 RepID=A0A1W0WTI7_HYPEX|nr:hypothetical protein BV898_07344 [Hypsibius exemplaris]